MTSSTLELGLPRLAPVVIEVSDADAICQIDVMTYEKMLRLVRNASLRDALFRGAAGRHFHATMKAKRHALSPEARAEISARVGF